MYFRSRTQSLSCCATENSHQKMTTRVVAINEWRMDSIICRSSSKVNETTAGMMCSWTWQPGARRSFCLYYQELYTVGIQPKSPLVVRPTVKPLLYRTSGMCCARVQNISLVPGPHSAVGGGPPGCRLEGGGHASLRNAMMQICRALQKKRAETQLLNIDAELCERRSGGVGSTITLQS